MSPVWFVGVLLGFAPAETGWQQGEDAPHLDRHLAVQQALSRTPRARAFVDAWGPHHVRWDERNGTPRSMLGPGLLASLVPQLVADVARLGGVDPRTLRLDRVTERGNRETWRYVQDHLGASIEGGGVVVHVRGGRIHLVTASLHLPKVTDLPRPGETLLADHTASPLDYTWTRRVEHPDRVVFLDRSGETIHGWSTVHLLDLEAEERTVGDALITAPARQVTVFDETGSEITADDGSHGLDQVDEVRLEGPSLLVRERGDPIEVTGLDDEFLAWDVDLFPSAASVQHHFHVAWDWLRDLWPDHPWLESQVTASLRLDGSCNAYYTKGTINFYEEGDGCEDFGRIADVIYHELGHGFHQYGIAEGTFAADVSEGSSDFLSATILDSPILAPGYKGDDRYIRELITDRRYPDDANGETHNDGLIWSSFLWNLREQWRESLGTDAGTRAVDALFLETLSYGPTLTDMTEAVLAADDDNGDFTDATPHACELIDLLNHHGLGPGSLGLVQLEHEPLGAQSSSVTEYPVSFTLTELTPGCGVVDPLSVRLFYAVGLEDDADGIDPADLLEVMPTQSGDSYTANIPRQLPGTRVSYALSWASGDRETTYTTYEEQPDGLWSFWVGDREALWCGDFEDDWQGFVPSASVFGKPPGSDWVDQWERDAPLGQDWNPSSAWAGTQVIGTVLSGDGLYAAHNGQKVVTPDLRLVDADPRMLLLTARRWLTVEDARYDRAEVWVDSDLGRERLWGNPETQSGSWHLLDTEWTLFDLDLGWLAGSPEDRRFAFSLDADGGLQYGGWALDEVCLVTLADVPGHYRVRDLDASDDAETLTIRWTQPMIEPLVATVLVRKRDGLPQHAEDGLILDMDLSPVPGQLVEVVDSEALAGETWHYALFASDESGHFYDEVVEGENGDAGSIPWPELPDSGAIVDTGDTGGSDSDSAGLEPPDSDPLPQDELDVEDGSCGCASMGGSAPGGWLLLAWIGWTRRRVSDP